MELVIPLPSACSRPRVKVGHSEGAGEGEQDLCEGGGTVAWRERQRLYVPWPSEALSAKLLLGDVRRLEECPCCAALVTKEQPQFSRGRVGGRLPLKGPSQPVQG